MNKLKQEPLFGCCQCYEEFSWPARDLRIIDGELWCENCWSQADFEPALDFKEYPAFVPDYDKKIFELETRLAELLKAAELVDRCDQLGIVTGRALSVQIDMCRRFFNRAQK
jgi:hypothetical protein